MKRIYKFSFENGKYVFAYTNSKERKEVLEIDSVNMELDSERLYKLIFEDYIQNTELFFENNMNEAELDKDIFKKGCRVFQTVKGLCDEIKIELDKKVWDEEK